MTESTPLVLTEIDAGVGIVTLNRADRHNVFDAALIRELDAAFGMLAGDGRVRVVVLSAAGKSFCAGADLNWMRAAAGQSREENEADALALARMLERLATLPQPTVARVQGSAYGGGIGLIAACDIAFGTFDAQFALSEVKLGLIPATIAPHVIGAIGVRHARRYMLTAERFSAAEAYRIGLLHEMVADETALDAAVGQLVEALLCNGPRALAECKQLIRAVAYRDIRAVIDDTAQRIARVRATDEGREGMAAFLERRPPRWVS
jgi:methylglutaconyl-CoA hydratase